MPTQDTLGVSSTFDLTTADVIARSVVRRIWAFRVPRPFMSRGDIYQEAMVRIISAWTEDYRPPEGTDLRTDLFIRVLSDIRNMLNREWYRENKRVPDSRRSLWPELEDTIVGRREDASTGPVQIDDQVQEAVARLPYRQREVIRHRYYDGLTQQQTADKMNTTQVSVCRLLEKAHNNVKHILAEIN